MTRNIHTSDRLDEAQMASDEAFSHGLLGELRMAFRAVFEKFVPQGFEDKTGFHLGSEAAQNSKQKRKRNKNFFQSRK